MPAVPSQNSLPSFDQELCGLVLDTAPRQFAVVQVYDGDGQDADGGLRPGGSPTETGWRTSSSSTGIHG
ncbi:hypothetical protein OHV13_31805 [Kitasatospora purpeofusca]|uniref:hypothetical protein n=1 Tax=Kitasatospora purpeofusca TaxID=67352 RepID=UPI0032464BAD